MSALINARALVSLIADVVRSDPDARRELVAAFGLNENGAAPQLLTVAAFATARSLGKSTVWRAIGEDRLPVVRIGRAVRIAADAVIASRATSTALARAERKLGLVRGGAK